MVESPPKSKQNTQKNKSVKTETTKGPKTKNTTINSPKIIINMHNIFSTKIHQGIQICVIDTCCLLSGAKDAQ